MQKIVLLVGFKGSGKNTAAEALEARDYKAISFADPVKDAIASIFCWDREALNGTTPESRKWRETECPWWSERLDIAGLTPRWVMQNFGTDIMRRHFNDRIWILSAEHKIAECSPRPVVITDGRFANEIDMVHSLGGKVVRIKRGPDPGWFHIAKLRYSPDALISNQATNYMQSAGVHESEYAWVGADIDVVIENSGDIADLHSKMGVQPSSETRPHKSRTHHP